MKRVSGYRILGRVTLPVQCPSRPALAERLRGFADACRDARA